MFGIATIKLVMIGAALLAPFVSYGWGRVEGKLEKAAAVRAERSKQIRQCNDRVSTIQDKINQDAADAEDRARTAASAVTETPLVPLELKKLCDASPTCRSRGAK